MRDRIHLAVLVAATVCGCVATSVTPPLSPRPLATDAPQGAIWLTSGAFERPHRDIGIVQMTQEGYRWLHEIELVPDANPESMLYQLARYVHELGGDGIEQLELVDENPQSPEEKTAKQVVTFVRLYQQARDGRAPTAAADGTKTRYQIKGQLVKFEEGGIAP